MAALTEGQVIPLMLDACPGFQHVWKEHLAWWREQDRGIYNDTGEIARYLVESLCRGETQELRSAFDTIERLIREGDDQARAAAIVGILEAVQVISTHHPCGPSAFVPWLGPRSQIAWAEIESAWAEGGGSLAGVIRNENTPGS